MDGVGRGVRSRGRLGVAARADAFRQRHRHGHQQRRLSVPNVEVVATNQATQVAYTASSNDQGLYTITALPIGTYIVRADGAELPAVRDEPIKLESGQTARVDITLQVGATEQVEVTGVTPILQTQDAVVGEVISETTIERMPLNGRNFSQLSLLLPGVMTTAPDTLHRAEELRRRDVRT